MDNSRGIQAVTHCEITNMHNIEHKEDSMSVIFQLTYYSLNLFRKLWQSKIDITKLKPYLFFVKGYV